MSEHAPFSLPPCAPTEQLAAVQLPNSRLLNSRAGRGVASIMAATGLLLGSSISEVNASEDPLMYSVVNAPDGVYSRNSPHTEDTPRVDGQGIYNGDVVQLQCGVTNGDPVGPNDNTLWHKVVPYFERNIDPFWVSDYFVSSGISGRVPGRIAPYEPMCSAQDIPQTQVPVKPENQPQQQKGCYFNLRWLKRNLTFSYEGGQRYYKNAKEAAQNWTDLDAGFTITPAPKGKQGDIVFKDINTSDQLIYARAGIKEVIGSEDSYTTIPKNPAFIMHQGVTVLVNQYTIEGHAGEKYRLNDRGKTYALTHELGHVLGLGHPNGKADGEFIKHACYLDVDNTNSIMKEGKDEANVSNLPFNTPQPYDKMALEKLYSNETPEEIRIKKIWHMLSKIFPFGSLFS